MYGLNLASGGEMENPLLPPIPELVIGLVAFLIVFIFLGKKLLPNINKVLNERRAAIEGGMEKAAAAQTEAQQVLEDYRAQLADARHEAARLRQEAQEQGVALIAEMRSEGQRQREEIIAAQPRPDRGRPQGRRGRAPPGRGQARHRPGWPGRRRVPRGLRLSRAAASTASSTRSRSSRPT
ncbi:hypothetical protein GCM10020000_25760 [Streptomyces olivoverticillatus]